jgi:hypothetical protein
MVQDVAAAPDSYGFGEVSPRVTAAWRELAEAQRRSSDVLLNASSDTVWSQGVVTEETPTTQRSESDADVAAEPVRTPISPLVVALRRRRLHAVLRRRNGRRAGETVDGRDT